MCMWSLFHGYFNWKRVYEREIKNVDVTVRIIQCIKTWCNEQTTVYVRSMV